MSFPVSIDREGKTYYGEYSVLNGILTLTTAVGGVKQTQVGGMPPEVLAKQLLGELAREERA